MSTAKNSVKRADLLFLYDFTYCVANGDPFTGSQRVDEATKRGLISDVRIKRYIRDFILMYNALHPDKPFLVFLQEINLESMEKLGVDVSNMSGAAAQVGYLRSLFKDDPTVVIKATEGKGKGKKSKDTFDVTKLLLKCLDVRLFGAVSTEKESSVHLTGPVQFNALNPTLNKIELRTHQNTSHFVSSTNNAQGAIGTSTLVPYGLAQIVGSVSPLIAMDTGLEESEVLFMCQAMWNGLNSYRSRSKMGQNSRLLLKINYTNPWAKCSSLQDKININDENTELRKFSEVTWDFSKLEKYISSKEVDSAEYMVEEELKPIFDEQMKSVSSKLIQMKSDSSI